MSANKNKAIWFLFTTMLSIFNICTIYIFARNWPFYAVTLNAILSLGGLVFQMHVDDKRQKKLSLLPVRIILWINSVSVFLMLGLSLFTLTSQYHNHLEPDKTIHSVDELTQVMEESEDGVYLLETDELYIYYADYNNISFVAGKRPSKEDESSIMCVAAAFQGSYEPGFSHDNIVGWHASGGQLERGKPEKNLGAFTYVDGEARIFNIEDSEAAIKEAAERGGCGFQQFVVLYNGERGTHSSDEFRCYRVLAVINGKACIIDTKTQMHYDEFVMTLEDFGIQNALYCDMGSGWNYSWYRKANGKTVDIIGTPWLFSHNWLVFEK